MTGYRLHANYLFGTLSAGISTSDLTINGAFLANLPAISAPTYCPLTLQDPTSGVFEIIHVTAHTASATSATVTRAQEGSTARSWVSGAFIGDNPLLFDVGAVDTLANLNTNAAMYQIGARSVDSDNGRNHLMTGAGWLAPAYAEYAACTPAHDGTATPATANIQIACGTYNLTTNGSGIATITIPKPFPNKMLYAEAIQTGSASSGQLFVTTLTASTIAFAFKSNGGALQTSTSVSGDWMAFGY